MATSTGAISDILPEEGEESDYVNASIFKSLRVGDTFRVRRGSVDSVGSQRDENEGEESDYVNASIFKSLRVGDTFRVRRGSVDSVGSQRDENELQMRIRRERCVRRKMSRAELEGDMGYLTAREIVHTERNYVTRLQLLEELRTRNDAVQVVNKEVMRKMLPNLDSILKFHQGYLLPKLEDRLIKWTTDGGRMGDVFRQCQPYLREYSDYMLGLKEAQKLLRDWTKKSSKFAAIVIDIERKPESSNVKLENHMLEPVQRLPRYLLLLQRYVKHLPQTSPDLEDATASLAMIKKVADYVDDVLFRSDNHEGTLGAYRKIRGDLSESMKRRILVKEGVVNCLDGKSGMTFDLYLFLFTDVLLMCAQASRDKYTLSREIGLRHIEVRPGKGENRTKFLLLCRDNAYLVEDRQDGGSVSWYQELRKLLDRGQQRKLEREDSAHCSPEEDDSIYFRLPPLFLGRWAPRRLSGELTDSCLSCFLSFLSCDRNKNFCDTCSLVICDSCCRAAMVEYLEQEGTVCLECYHVLSSTTT